MDSALQSILLGTAGLSIAALAALGLAASRPLAAPAAGRVRVVGAAAVLVHAVHFTEEATTGFAERFPELLGAEPWPMAFFVAFNVVWMTVWLGCLPLLRRYPRAAVFPLWFLAIAATANAVAHPALALATGGYFPGLWSSVLEGALGVVLLRALLSGSSRRTSSQAAPASGKAQS